MTAYTITFKDAETGTRAQRLTPHGGLTTRKMFAAMITDKRRAEQIASEIRADFPDAVVKVQKF